MSRSKKLYKLQKIDSELDQNMARLLEIEKALSDNALVREAEEASQDAERIFDETRKSLTNSEGEVRAQRIKIEQSESSLYSGKVINPKELQDLQNEIAALKRFLVVLEDRQLENMLTVDNAKEIHQDKLEILSQVHEKEEIKNVGLIDEKSKIEEKSQHQKTKRDKQWQLIAKNDQDIYSSVRKKRAGIAVTMVSNQACSACGTTLTEVIFRATRSPSQLIFCDTCDRILYSE